MELSNAPSEHRNLSCLSCNPSRLIAIVFNPTCFSRCASRSLISVPFEVIPTENPKVLDIPTIRMQQWFAASNAYHNSCRIITLCNSPQCLLNYTVIQICVIISGTFTAAMQTVQLTFVRKLQKEEAQPWMAVKALLMFCKI